jgi:pimeloyl-ACP methyl ester carboxylesterase
MSEKSVKGSEPLIFNSRVDNFDSSNNATFAQRYYVDNQFWTGTGPVFYYISGEGTCNGPPTGYVASLGKQYSALLISLEHRFYGESIPNGNALSENYKYLSVEQALADLSNFTNFYKEQVPATQSVPWVVFGGSYSGGLSSWYRATYPEQSVAALSSSGVVNCIVNFYQFDMQVDAQPCIISVAAALF